MISRTASVGEDLQSAGQSVTKMQRVLTEYFRCPDDASEFTVASRLPKRPGYFSFGPEITCYGRARQNSHFGVSGHQIRDVLADVHVKEAAIELPFDPDEVIENLRRERYAAPLNLRSAPRLWSKIRDAYYLARPLLPVGLRKYLQRFHLSGWERLSFPKWPVDSTVDRLLEKLLSISIRSTGMKAVPFIWFWPEGANAAAIMTHDVETGEGVRRSPYLMDVDESFGMPAAFQIVPERRYAVTESYLDEIRRRGFEVNVQDLNHDGKLFGEFTEFKNRVVEINRYGREFRASGFRSAVLYRNQEWHDLLQFEYDMSVPNVAHLDPQHGGCCTVMPYFVGKVLELPVTMTQDYTLFYILKDFSVSLWKQQSDLILQRHGLIHMIVHPDYLDCDRNINVYRNLLSLLAELRRDKNVWVTLPGEVNRWWRERSRMELVCQNGCWRVEGPGSERARVAFASLEGDQLTYSIQKQSEADNSTRSRNLFQRRGCYPRNEI